MDWSREELDASVVAYIEMRNLERQGKKFSKKQFYKRLSETFGRSPSAFEYRMQNISHVYSKLGRQWVRGLAPARNVGANVAPIIEELIHQHEGNVAISLLPFEQRVEKLLSAEALPLPQGNLTPAKQLKETTTYVRDPYVVAWILKNSEGICESCDGPAPFTKPDGYFYLEVHHLRRLADGGSDTPANAVAVCPNCHRQLHYAADKETVLSNLYEKVSRLVRE